MYAFDISIMQCQCHTISHIYDISAYVMVPVSRHDAWGAAGARYSTASRHAIANTLGVFN